MIRQSALRRYHETAMRSAITSMMSCNPVDSRLSNNIVNLAGGTIFGTVYGGYVADTSGTSSNNTLNVTGATTAGNIAKFDTYNFELPAETKANDVHQHAFRTAEYHQRQ